ncbi:MAG: phosphoribosyltransferase, partial [Polyangiales bacterium]
MSHAPLFRDRSEAGQLLGARLSRYRCDTPLILGLPRGGVAVAYEVAHALGAPLDVWVVRKIGAPLQPELAIGAVAEGGEIFLDEETMEAVGVTAASARALAATKRAEVEERCRLFRRGARRPEIAGRTVIVVDDGLATGATARASLRALRRLGPKRLVLAVPIGAADSVAALAKEADEVVCLAPRDDLVAVGHWYEDFDAVADDEVLELLARARKVTTPPPLVVEQPVLISAADAELVGDLAIPTKPRG